MFTKYTIAAVAAVALTGAVANAGVVTYNVANNDAASNISTSYTYTAKTSMGSSASVVNGVTFDAIATAGNTLTATGITAVTPVSEATPSASWKSDAEGFGYGLGGGGNVAAGGFHDLLIQFRYSGNGATSQEYTLSGLTAGQTYDLRVYGRSFTPDVRNVSLNFTGDGTTSNYTFNEDGSADGWYISHVFTYDGTSTPGFTAGGNFHVYGLSNQVVVPEPASLSLLGLGGLLLGRRRRA